MDKHHSTQVRSSKKMKHYRPLLSLKRVTEEAGCEHTGMHRDESAV